jgi:hypothetical protein
VDTLIGRYFWVICIGVTLINFRGLLSSALKTTLDPADKNKNEVLSRRILWALLAPWLVMGFGQVFGGVPSVWSYFRPQDRNPYVWGWYLSIFLMACTFAYWIIFRGGAEKAIELRLIRISGFRGEVQLSEFWIKVIAAIGPIWIAVWVWYASTLNTPIPP